MSFHLVSRFLLRAPLLPVRGLRNPSATLRRHPLGRMAVELASPELAAALGREPGSAAVAFDSGKPFNCNPTQNSAITITPL